MTIIALHIGLFRQVYDFKLTAVLLRVKMFKDGKSIGPKWYSCALHMEAKSGKND